MGDFDGGAVFGATVIVALVWSYVVAARGKEEWNPLVLTQGPLGRASLSNLQLVYFLTIVLWAVIYVLWDGQGLTEIPESILQFIGIGVAGTAGAKVVGTYRGRISSGNWAWLRVKGWIDKSIEKEDEEGPKVADLVSTGDRFDPTKFQALVFSLAVGVYMIQYLLGKGSWKGFEVGAEYLALIGLSQAVYVGGKAVSPPETQQLEAEIKKARKLEADFLKKVSEAWQSEPPPLGPTIPPEPVAKPVPAGAELAEKERIEAENREAHDNWSMEKDKLVKSWDPDQERNKSAKAVALDQYNAYVAQAKVVTNLIAERTEDYARPRTLEPGWPKLSSASDVEV